MSSRRLSLPHHSSRRLSARALTTLAMLATPLLCRAQIISTVAGAGIQVAGDGGPATNAEFNNPSSVAVDSVGNLYIGDGTAQRIRKADTAGS